MNKSLINRFTFSSSMDTLIPNEVPISIKILLSSNERFFLTTETQCHPKAVIRSAIMHFQVMNVSYFYNVQVFSFHPIQKKHFPHLKTGSTFEGPRLPWIE
jgi:hypothetical protein